MLRFLHSHIFTEADLWVLLRIDFLKSILVLVPCLADDIVQVKLDSPAYHIKTPNMGFATPVSRGGCCDNVNHAPLAGPPPNFRNGS